MAGLSMFAACLIAIAPVLFLTPIDQGPGQQPAGSGSPAVSAAPDEDVGQCTCTVINKIDPGTTSGKCPSGGASVPCISAGAATYPQGGQPEDGICLVTPLCLGSNKCTYKTMRVRITFATCAAACGVASPVPWTVVYPVGVANPGYPPILPVPGGAYDWDLLPGAINNNCGAGQHTVELKFLKTSGLDAFSIRAIFGCGQCSAAQ
jgi:hypothetical protein